MRTISLQVLILSVFQQIFKLVLHTFRDILNGCSLSAYHLAEENLHLRLSTCRPCLIAPVEALAFVQQIDKGFEKLVIRSRFRAFAVGGNDSAGAKMCLPYR